MNRRCSWTRPPPAPRPSPSGGLRAQSKDPVRIGFPLR